MTNPTAQPSAEDVRSVLRWMGSKRRLASEIVDRMPRVESIGTYFEPFFGGGSVFFNYRPPSAVIGDINGELTNAWTQVRDAHDSVHAGVQSLAVDPDTYYDVRAQSPTTLSPLDAAVRFVYLNRNCFNGIYRTNRRNQFNVPFGSNTGALPALDAFAACARALEGVTIRSSDFEESVDTAGPGDIVYLDPPWETARASYGEYGYTDSAAPTTARIAEVVDGLRGRGVTCYVSLPSAQLGSFKDLARTDFSLTYNVASSSTKRRLSQEVLLVSSPELSGCTVQ